MTDWTDSLAEPTSAEIEAVARAIHDARYDESLENPEDGPVPRRVTAIDVRYARAALTADPLRAALIDVVRAVMRERMAKNALNDSSAKGWPTKQITEEWYQTTLAVTAALGALKGLVA